MANHLLSVVAALLISGSVCNQPKEAPQRPPVVYDYSGEMLEGMDKDGRMHGLTVFYYPNGSVESRGMYDHGLKDGEWVRFGPRGETLSVRVYDADEVRKWTEQ